MKVNVTQVYEMTITVQVDAPDDWNEDDLYNALEDFHVNATMRVAEIDDEIVVNSLCVDSLIALSGGTTITDENGKDLWL